MKLGKPLATGVAEERPSHTETPRPENRSEPRGQVRTERPEPAEAPAGR